MNVTNNNNEHLRYLVNTVGGGGVHHFARFHHVSTKESWTEEEFQAASQKFSRNVEARDIYLEDYLNFSHEASRRAQESSRNNNQFTFITNNFSPHILTSNSSREHDSTIFNSLATMLSDQKVGLSTLRESFGNRFLSEEEFEQRLQNLHNQFNEAIQSVADVFRGFAQDLGLNAREVESKVLQIGDIIRDSIWSGGSAADAMSMLDSAQVTELNRMGNAWHRR